MRYGFALPETVDIWTFIELSKEAEAAGWDGVFYWDIGLTDAFIALSAAALQTERLRLGTFVTPLPRAQPWKVASEMATLDILSKGRAILPVGLGVIEMEKMGIVKDNKIRARMLDEGLEIVSRFWSGEEFSYDGEYYQVEPTTGIVPVQQPRVPVWVVGGDKNSQLRRAARWDGAIVKGPPAEVAERKKLIESRRESATPLDIITEAETPADDPSKAAEIVRSYAEAGVTWWLESIWDTPRNQGGLEGMRKRIKQGPPRYEE